MFAGTTTITTASAALLDIFAQDGLNQTFHIAPLVSQVLYLRKSAIVDIVHEGAFPFCIGLGGDACHIDVMKRAKFSKREWIQANLIVAARQVGSQLATEQFGIATSNEDTQAGAFI